MQVQNLKKKCFCTCLWKDKPEENLIAFLTISCGEWNKRKKILKISGLTEEYKHTDLCSDKDVLRKNNKILWAPF